MAVFSFTGHDSVQKVLILVLLIARKTSFVTFFLRHELPLIYMFVVLCVKQVFDILPHDSGWLWERSVKSVAL